METRLSGQPTITLHRIDGRDEYFLRTDETAAIGTTVCLGVAHLTGRTPADLPPLGGVVDVDALDDIFDESRGADPSVRFVYQGHTVTVLSRQYCRLVPRSGE